MMKKWQVWLGILISVIFLIFAFRGLNINEILAAISSAEIIWILPAIPVYFFGLWMRTMRWKIFLKPISDIKMRALFPTVAIGYMGNNIYPARLGEIVRSAILKKENNTPISASLATIFIERIFDGLVMLGFILLNLTVIRQMSHSAEIQQTIDAIAAWGSGIFLFAFFAFLIAAFFPQPSLRLIESFLSRLFPEKFSKPVSEIAEKFFSGIQSLQSPATIAITMAISIAIWLVEAIFYWMVMQAFPFSIGLNAILFLVGFLNLFTIIPSTPGYIGTFDAPGIALLSALGIEGQNAAGYTLLLHASLWLPVTVVGAFYFFQKGLSWNETINQAKVEQLS